MKPFLTAATLVLGLFLSVPQHADAQTLAHSRQQIEGIVETFRTAITNKDKDSFMKLFLREDVTWVTAITDRSRDLIAASRSDKTMPRPLKIGGTGTPREFIEGIVKAGGRREETFDNVRIDTDGDIAQVWFDYSFKKDGHKSNWGKEAWQLVRTDEGWKIVSVIWSTEFNPEPPPQAK